MRILTTSDLSYVSGGDSYFCDEGGQWYTYTASGWLPGLLVSMAYDAAVAGYRWASNNVNNATDDSVTYNCNAAGNCW